MLGLKGEFVPTPPGRVRQVPFFRIGVLTWKRHTCWPLLAKFDIYHIEWILVSKYCKGEHLGVFWPVSLEDLLIPKKRTNPKRTFIVVIVPNA